MLLLLFCWGCGGDRFWGVLYALGLAEEHYCNTRHCVNQGDGNKYLAEERKLFCHPHGREHKERNQRKYSVKIVKVSVQKSEHGKYAVANGYVTEYGKIYLSVRVVKATLYETEVGEFGFGKDLVGVEDIYAKENYDQCEQVGCNG